MSVKQVWSILSAIRIICSLPARPRDMLLRVGYFGDVADPIRVRLHRAYLHFKKWCASSKVSCSQPNFREYLVPWMISFWLSSQPNSIASYVVKFAWVVIFLCLMLSRTKLYLKDGHILMLCKAWNGRVVMQWLTETLASVSQQEPFKSRDDTMAIVALAMFLDDHSVLVFWPNILSYAKKMNSNMFLVSVALERL